MIISLNDIGSWFSIRRSTVGVTARVRTYVLIKANLFYQNFTFFFAYNRFTCVNFYDRENIQNSGLLQESG